MSRVVLAVWSVVAGGLLSGSALHRGGEAAGVTAQSSRFGVRVIVTAGRATYPRNALVVARLRVINTSHRAISLQTVCAPGSRPYSPMVARVVDARGRVLFPPAVGGEQGQICPPPSPFALPPGRSVLRREYVILRSPRLQAVVQLPRRRGGLVAVTANLRLRLVGADAPTITLRRSPELAAAVRLRHPGPLIYNQWASCSSPAGQLLSAESSNWVRSTQTRIAPLCVQPLQWQLVVGQVNHSVAQVRYSRTGNG